jgi:hypothetical protein
MIPGTIPDNAVGSATDHIGNLPTLTGTDSIHEGKPARRNLIIP